MKTTTLLCVSAWLALSAPAAFAATPSPACEAKRAQIQAQLAEATERGRRQEVAGLKKALRANQANCSDAALEKEREGKIRQAQKKVNEREASLREAGQKGDAKKQASRQAKLDEARRELAEAEQPLPH